MSTQNPRGLGTKNYKIKKLTLRHLRNFLGFPSGAIMLNETMQRELKLTKPKKERLAAVLPLLRGRLLDIGCGKNELVNTYRKLGGEGIGVDVFPFKGVDQLVDTTNLPFEEGEFDTVAMIACLNHVPARERDRVLSEANRVLKGGGRLLLTMIGGFSGWFCHKLCWWEFDQKERGMDNKEEDYGLSGKYVIELAERNRFRIVQRRRFGYGLNNLFVFRKSGAGKDKDAVIHC